MQTRLLATQKDLNALQINAKTQPFCHLTQKT